MKPRVVKIARLPAMLDEALYATYEVVEASEDGTGIGAATADIRVMVANGESTVTRELMAQLPALEIIAVLGVGYDGVDVAAARERGIQVTHTPDVLTDDVADFAMALLLGIARNTRVADQFTRSGAWAKGAFPFSRKVTGARLGIIGLGRIGKAIARRAQAFDMSIAYTGRHPQDVEHAYFASAEELAAAVDFLVIAVGGGAGTQHLVDAKVLEALGPQGYLINVGRGSVVDEKALVQALSEGRVAGAALDVYENEPRPLAELFAFENVLLTPHMASATLDTRKAMSDLVMANLQAWQEGAALPTPVPK
jgi:lactate dehydrogenase-like 2-hydroxyacid dehydrogenase